MSLRFEQYRALLKTRDFLRSLMHPSTRPKTVGDLREGAYRCLRHFPVLKESGEPMWSQDAFEFKPPPRAKGAPEGGERCQP